MSAYSDEVSGHTNLVAYWRYNESSGTSATDSKGTNTGTLAGSGVTYSVTGALVNDTNKALTFSGSVNPMTAPDAAALDLGDGPFSLEFWIKRGRTATQEQIFTKGTNAYAVQIQSSETFGLYKFGVGSFIVTSNTNITDTTT